MNKKKKERKEGRKKGEDKDRGKLSSLVKLLLGLVCLFLLPNVDDVRKDKKRIHLMGGVIRRYSTGGNLKNFSQELKKEACVYTYDFFRIL